MPIAKMMIPTLMMSTILDESDAVVDDDHDDFEGATQVAVAIYAGS